MSNHNENGHKGKGEDSSSSNSSNSTSSNTSRSRLSEEERKRIVKRARRMLMQFLHEERSTIFEERAQEEKAQQEEQRQKDLVAIDNLLDEYNDYMALYQNFKDEEYKEKADLVMAKLNTGDYS